MQKKKNIIPRKYRKNVTHWIRGGGGIAADRAPVDDVRIFSEHNTYYLGIYLTGSPVCNPISGWTSFDKTPNYVNE